MEDSYQDVLIRIPKSLYQKIGHIAVDWELSKRETIHHLLRIAVDEVTDDCIDKYIKETGGTGEKE